MSFANKLVNTRGSIFWSRNVFERVQYHVLDLVQKCNFGPPYFLRSGLKLAGFRAYSEIIGKFRKLKKFYDHFVKRQK